MRAAGMVVSQQNQQFVTHTSDSYLCLVRMIAVQFSLVLFAAKYPLIVLNSDPTSRISVCSRHRCAYHWVYIGSHIYVMILKAWPHLIAS